LGKLYVEAKAFLALARDEDFGITPVEAMMAGTPVIAYDGGGYRETVVDGKTGVLFNDYSVGGVVKGMHRLQATSYKPQEIIKWAERFSKERFVKEMKELVKRVTDK